LGDIFVLFQIIRETNDNIQELLEGSLDNNECFKEVTERIFLLDRRSESILQNCKSLIDLIKEDGKKHSFWRSRHNTANKRGNNVFISTKLVYKALTEDFI